MTVVLGVSCYFHDSTAALCIDGEVVAAVAEERFTLRKHDASFPVNAIDFCMRFAGVEARELNYIVFYERPFMALARTLTLLLAGVPHNLRRIGSTLHPWFSRRLWIRTQLVAKLGIEPKIVLFCPHHMSHAAHAFLTSPFDRAAILTLDGVGEWSSGSLCVGDRAEALPIRAIKELSFFSSLGLTYAAVTRLLGMKPNEDECSTMALAGFAEALMDPAAAELTLPDALNLELDPRFDDERMFNPPFREYFDTLPGAGDFGALDARRGLVDVGAACPRRSVALACKAQSRLESEAIAIAQELRERTRSSALCLAGGVANNAMLVSKLAKESGFQDIFVPLDPGDGGAAIGAALWACSEARSSMSPSVSAYLGVDVGQRMREELLRAWHISLAQEPGACIKTFDSIEEVAAAAADLLARGRVVGWMQQRAEFGPRALGNRSILALPSCIELADRIADDIKQRPRFRPFALSVLDEDADEVLQLLPSLRSAYCWMQAVCEVRPQALERVRAATHIDGTTRPQIVASANNPPFASLLREVRSRTGLGALLNTSLNTAGMPLVNDEVDALLFFKTTPIDALACGTVLATRAVCNAH